MVHTVAGDDAGVAERLQNLIFIADVLHSLKVENQSALTDEKTAFKKNIPALDSSISPSRRPGVAAGSRGGPVGSINRQHYTYTPMSMGKNMRIQTHPNAPRPSVSTRWYSCSLKISRGIVNEKG